MSSSESYPRALPKASRVCRWTYARSPAASSITLGNSATPLRPRTTTMAGAAGPGTTVTRRPLLDTSAPASETRTAYVPARVARRANRYRPSEEREAVGGAARGGVTANEIWLERSTPGTSSVPLRSFTCTTHGD
eukprot:1196244-Prorocentrum_minimum.AAC.6